ncbi:N-acetylmuramic acid 6-phosphate etherase [Roseivivax isoporae]|uniref:Acetylmuramic acid-6-phosphate etherase n=1 Tax=Roseivivax isoporae LMG 25204 TaxID=1449351 RepID=X7F352_9RHOB|nr:N-acetylmuramic acid 6-phosphate etherase [Roseivivax isoporae]ETX27352.1 acetylmuramic acid-6-phosphate etherase [Roseivivax isoporae LMG 25204]
MDRTTERLHPDAANLDRRPPREAAALLAEGQIAAATALRGALDAFPPAAAAMAATIRAGGVLHYVAAGSSGLMAAADAQELGGTFSIPAAQLRIHMAGGLPRGVEMPGGTEDDTGGLADALATLGPEDTVIAVSASGTTPYTLAAADIARARGATIIAIANNPGAPLLAGADHAILLETPPEVLSGSTRMGAGTAQKIALNMLSTLMALDLGHVHDGMMVNLRADNTKLRARAAGIVARVAAVDEAAARRALEATRGEVKAAVLVAARGLAPAEARAALDAADGHLRAALARPR